ncbi:MAG: HXXEE domain-containing protein [Erysipelotrichaceae bacterium]|nr:HXXEE domain-containing protein [Erysipelotrichaceae bacterium]
MNKFMEKYSYIITGILGVIALIVLILYWNNMSMLEKLPIIYIVALAIHETEELKLPGGFVELVTSMTGLQLNNLGIAKFGLFIFTIYATVVPVFLADYIWPVMATLLIGFIEILAHLLAARINTDKFYSPGMISAIFVQFPVAVFGYYYLLMNHMIQPIYFLYAFIFLLVPLFCLQAMIVKSNGQKYGEFINNARKSLLK